jgi:hypothetical protein
MAKKMTRTLADDVRASLCEALDHAAGKCTKAIIHRVTPRDPRIKVIKAVRRADKAR